jgi:hypothetical protein
MADFKHRGRFVHIYVPDTIASATTMFIPYTYIRSLPRAFILTSASGSHGLYSLLIGTGGP